MLESLYIIVYHCISLYIMVYHGPMVYHCISLYIIVYHGISLYIIVYHCISLYIIVYHCISLYSGSLFRYHPRILPSTTFRHTSHVEFHPSLPAPRCSTRCGGCTPGWTSTGVGRWTWRSSFASCAVADGWGSCFSFTLWLCQNSY